MQVELDQTQLIEAVATKIADRLLADGKWLSHAYQAMWDRAEKTLKNREETRQKFGAAYEAAVQRRLALIEAEVLAVFSSENLVQAARRAEQRAQASLDQAAQDIVKESKAKMQRTIRKAVGDLLKDRVDAVLLRLFSAKDVQI